MVLIDEDKYICSLRKKPKYRESQIFAEILAYAFTNFDNTNSSTIEKSQMVYTIKVIGT
ncbi:15528_t:CDS:1, partial [Racocetra persica]